LCNQDYKLLEGASKILAMQRSVEAQREMLSAQRLLDVKYEELSKFVMNLRSSVRRLHMLLEPENGSLNYPHITRTGQDLKKQSTNFIKAYHRLYKSKTGIMQYKDDKREFITTSKNIGKNIKRVIKRNLKSYLFPKNAHKNVYNYIGMLETVADTLMSVT